MPKEISIAESAEIEFFMTNALRRNLEASFVQMNVMQQGITRIVEITGLGR